jgi:hypothetical protein
VALNLKHPTQAEPGKKYSFTIRPRRDKPPVTLLLATADDGPEVERIIQPNGDEIAVESDMTSIALQIDDYDADGDLDFRLATNAGSGGTWYAYFRYDGKQYAEWEEPSRLGINTFDKEKRVATAFSRSGPSYLSTSYKLADGHFVAIARETRDKAKNLREHVEKDIPDDAYVVIKETLEEGKVTKRSVTKDDAPENQSD